MSAYCVKFFGSASDLESLLKSVSDDTDCFEMKEAANTIHASSDIIPLGILLAITATPHVSACFQTWMRERGKRLVSRDGSKITISGPFSDKRFKEFLESVNRVDVENITDGPPQPEEPQREIGFHTGLKSEEPPTTADN